MKKDNPNPIWIPTYFNTTPCPPLSTCFPDAPPAFPSPNSSLPQEELNQLQECIEEANNLLHVISNPRDPENTRALQLFLLTLRGLKVQATIACDTTQEKLIGTLTNAGKDFIELTNEKKGKVLIPYLQLCLLKRDCNQNPIPQPLPFNFTPPIRQNLILHFGKTVAANPLLINTFFGISLSLYLQGFIGKKITIRLQHEEEPIQGILIDVQEEDIDDDLRPPAKIQIKVANKIVEVDLDDVCFISVCPR
ncbi:MULTISPECIES: hypothetical protein [Bacillus]|uniref:hypothetical protein n=1 Tax=Bacillus TaxID=1386 RepID=UPI00031EC6F6|nr:MULTISPECIES: hypothetical protein [Bacillus]MBO1582817.1 hypothetical protein [Bacillus sp. XF8]MBY0598258.1 hypothetical protein [Bacillus bingmayongensis]